jgi:hypothetical protein
VDQRDPLARRLRAGAGRLRLLVVARLSPLWVVALAAVGGWALAL